MLDLSSASLPRFLRTAAVSCPLTASASVVSAEEVPIIDCALAASRPTTDECKQTAEHPVYLATVPPAYFATAPPAYFVTPPPAYLANDPQCDVKLGATPITAAKVVKILDFSDLYVNTHWIQGDATFFGVYAAGARSDFEDYQKKGRSRWKDKRSAYAKMWLKRTKNLADFNEEICEIIGGWAEGFSIAPTNPDNDKFLRTGYQVYRDKGGRWRSLLPDNGYGPMCRKTKTELQECVSNTRLLDYFKALGNELNVLDPKTSDDIYKTHIV
ncbi:proteasome/cyclosome [Paraphaeosphaeria sporulosa]